jgi:hypothetical protein
MDALRAILLVSVRVFDSTLNRGVGFRVSDFCCSVAVESTSRGRFEGCHGRFCRGAGFVLAVMPCLPRLLDVCRQLVLEHFLFGSGFNPNLNHSFVVLVPDYAFNRLLPTPAASLAEENTKPCTLRLPTAST